MTRLLKKLLRRRRLDRDLEDELRFHLEMQAAESGDRRSFGNPTALKEVCRDMWAFTSLESWWQDVRYALRTLARTPGVTLIALLALALGIGANTTVFTVVTAALNLHVGVAAVDRTVLINIDRAHFADFSRSFLDFRFLQPQVKSLKTVAAWRFQMVNVSDAGGLPQQYAAMLMSAGGFQIIGRQPVLGRVFTEADELPGAVPVVVLTYSIWQDRYGKDPFILGKTIRVAGVPRAVIGVMPQGVQFPEDASLWLPLTLEDVSRGVLLFGQLADGVKLAAARAELDGLARGLASKRPDTSRGPVVDVQNVLEIYGVYHARPMLYAMLVAVGFVLLIACADVANLLLARAAVRSREISIRIAIGAGRARVIRQLLVESSVLSIAGGFLGWLVAFGGLRWFDAATTKFSRPPWVDFSMHPRVLIFLTAITAGTGILFGLAPALRLAKVDVHEAVKDGGRGATGGARGRLLSNLLVAFEMTLCVVLLAGAGLLIRSSINTYGAPLGINPANVLTAHISLPDAKYPRPADEVSFHQRLKARLESLPGVESAAVASNLPTAGMLNLALATEDNPAFTAGTLIVSPDYFRAMQVQPRRGRLFQDREATAAVVNENFALQYWPGEDPLGKRIRTQGSQTWLTVTGVVPNIQQNFHDPLERTPLVYLPYAAAPQRVAFVTVRTRVPPGTLASAVRREVQDLDDDLPLYDIATLEDRVAQTRLEVGAFGALFTIFGVIALVLASVGLYGVIAHSVSQRTAEIGIRMAMGGSAGAIFKLVFVQGMRPLAWGLAVGLPAAFAVTRVLRMALVGVSPGDPATFAGVVSVLVLAGALGCAIPARRAVRVDPLVALRCE